MARPLFILAIVVALGIGVGAGYYLASPAPPVSGMISYPGQSFAGRPLPPEPVAAIVPVTNPAPAPPPIKNNVERLLKNTDKYWPVTARNTPTIRGAIICQNMDSVGVVFQLYVDYTRRKSEAALIKDYELYHGAPPAEPDPSIYFRLCSGSVGDATGS